MSAYLREVFGLSLAWLGVFRVAIASLLLLDLLGRSRSLIAHYTDVGVLPRAALRAELYEPGYWSLHMLSGEWPWQAALLLLHIVLAVLLLFGVRARVMAGLCWLLLGSLHVRNPMLVTGGDHLMRLMLFWSMFVPLTRMASREGADADGQVPRRIASAGTAAMIVQLCCMYWFSLLLKTGAPWREDFTALAQALAFEHYTKPAGFWLLAHPRLCELLTVAVMLLESLGPLLLFIPWRNASWRTLVVASFWCFHLGTALTMELGLFPWVCIACWLPLLPDAAFPSWLRERGWTSPRYGRLGRLGRAGSALVLLLLAYVLTWNLRSLDLERYQTDSPRSYSVVGRLLRLDQNWRLFTPSPPDDNGYFVVIVERDDGQSYDHMTGKPVTWAKPALISGMYPDHRWRKFFLNLRDDERAPQRLHFAEYLCRSDPAALRVEIDYVFEPQPPEQRWRTVLLEHACAR